MARQEAEDPIGAKEIRLRDFSPGHKMQDLDRSSRPLRKALRTRTRFPLPKGSPGVPATPSPRLYLEVAPCLNWSSGKEKR